MLFARDQSDGPVIARWWRRLRLWLVGRREETVLELSEWDLDVWEIGEDDLDFIPSSSSSTSTLPATHSAGPPPIPVTARAGDLPRALRPAAIAAPPDSAWDDVLARARAALVSDADPQHVARTPAPAFDPLASRPRVGRSRAPAPGRRSRRRRTTSSVSLACLSDEAVPRPIDRESSSGVSNQS